MVDLVAPRLELLSKLKAGKDFYLAYVPERIAPGKAIKEFTEGTRLVGGIEENSGQVVGELFRTVCKKIIETDVTTAEISKLSENTFRDVNIAYANELALICERFGVDVQKVIKLANTHPRVNILMPGPGVGGPCLPKDPFLLIHSLNFSCSLIRIAREVNDFMPKHMLKLIIKAIKNAKKDIASSNVTILGIAYKPDTQDSRLSPARTIIKNLLNLGSKVIVFDSWCKENFDTERKNSIAEAVKGSDCLVIITKHSEFMNLNLQEIKDLMNSNPSIVDGCRLVDPKLAKKTGFSYYGLGLG